jgi:hypothetical protein
MTLRDQILKEHTKANCNAIVKWIGDSQQRFDELFKLFLSDEYRIPNGPLALAMPLLPT